MEKVSTKKQINRINYLIRNCSFIFLVSILISSCFGDVDSIHGNINTSVVTQKIDSILTLNIYPTKSKIDNGRLNIFMAVPNVEFYNLHKLKLIRELSIYICHTELDNISEIYFEQYDTLRSSRYVPQKTFYKSLNGFGDIALMYNDKTIRDFEFYILKSISGYQLSQYWGMIDGIYKIKKTASKPPDLIDLVLKLANEFKEKNYDGEAKKTLQELQLVAHDMYLNHDIKFVPSHIDYFLNYPNQ